MTPKKNPTAAAIFPGEDQRVFNFSAGPAVLPAPILREAAEEMLNHRGDGMSVMEMSHRSPMFESIIQKTEADLRRLMNIPDTYEVLFLQGGASLQFAMAPMNLLSPGGTVDFLNTGAWGQKAITEAEKLGTAHTAASTKEENFSRLPDPEEIRPSANPDYLHYVTNNTIYGTRFPYIPDAGAAPLIADMSSNILSEPIDVSRFGLIFAGAQKNLGPAGVTVVIIRKDLIGRHRAETPTMLQYKTHADKQSLFNTPPCYAVYMVGKMLQWIDSLGGMEAVTDRNRRKAALLYEVLDNSRLFRAPVREKDRSLMNIPFLSSSPEMDKQFLAGAEKAGLVNLKGHRSVGGMRASIYNAMPPEGVQALADFIQDFEKRNQ